MKEQAVDFLKSKGIISKGRNEFWINWVKDDRSIELSQVLVDFHSLIKSKDVNSKIKYQDVIDLGFVRKDGNDNVYMAQYGYDWFWCEKKLYKKISAVWDCETQTVEIRKNGDEGHIIAKHTVSGLQELINWIKLLTSKENS